MNVLPKHSKHLVMVQVSAMGGGTHLFGSARLWEDGGFFQACGDFSDMLKMLLNTSDLWFLTFFRDPHTSAAGSWGLW